MKIVGLPVVSLWRCRLFFGLILAVFFLNGCGVYFNAFFNANKAFKQAEKTSQGNSLGVGGDSDYKIAIEKCLKIVDNYPKSALYDDALYILAVSYFRTKQYSRAERRFLDLQEQFPRGKYAPKIPLFLAQTKRELNEIDSAIVLFKEVAQKSAVRTERAEASLELGRYYTNQKLPLESRPYLLAVRDSLGNSEQRSTAQVMLADGYLETFEPQRALDAFQEITRTSKDPSGKFQASRKAVEAAYRARQISLGQSILTTLIRDKANFDSLGVLRLKMAEGYEIDESPEQALGIYRDLAKDENKMLAAEADYRIGLIYQFDLDDLPQAKEAYDEAIRQARNSIPGNLANQRAADISKLQQISKQFVIDSTTTKLKIDGAARNAYDLADLYWFQMNQPDSAIKELNWIIDSIPTASLTPEAMLKRAGMIQELTGDSLKVDSLLRDLLVQYPASDAAGQARIVLGLTGMPEDTASASYLMHRAEAVLVDDNQVDSARMLYQSVIDRFPKTKESMSAEFALIWLTDTYEAPGDSSIAFAYQEFLDSFPNAPQAGWIRSQLSGGIRTPRSGRDEPKPATDQSGQIAQNGEVATPDNQSGSGLNNSEEQVAQTTTDLEVNLYRSIEGDTIIDLPFPPDEIKKEFEFPNDGYVEGITEYYLVFHLLLDFSGRVIQDSLRVPTNVDEINRRAKESIESATFNATRVATEIQQGNVNPSKIHESAYWFVYRWRIPVPKR